MTRVSDYLRSNILGLVAIFIALSGTAWAAATIGANDIKDNAVRSKHIKGAQVRGQDVDAAQVQLRVGGACPEGQAIRVVNLDGTVACEVDDVGAGGGGSPTGPAGGDLAGSSYPNPVIADSAVNSATVLDRSLTGNDINESTLGQVPSALIGGLGRTGDWGECDAPSQLGATCASASINVPDNARALVIARAAAHATNPPNAGTAQCHIAVSGIGTVPDSEMTITTTAAQGHKEHFDLVAVTPPFPAGQHTFSLECAGFDGFPIDIDLARVAALAISPN